ncbi:MAG: hypothetical protein AB2551_01745 [Candidatus Thiodiazotropha sp.]
MISLNKISSKKQQGNASVETILFATVMVPLLGGLPLLGKISDINNTTTQTSRYLAWEQTISGPNHKSVEQLEREVNNRFFVKSDLLIRTDRELLTGEEYNNPMWTGYGYNDDDRINRMISSDSAPGVEVANRSPDSMAGPLSSGIKTIGSTMASFSGGEWNIEAEGLYTASVSVDIASNKYLNSGFDCNNRETEDVSSCVVRSNTIFVDSWDARNSTHAAERARTFVPAGALEQVGNAMAYVGYIPFFQDIRGLRSDSNGGFGYVNANVLPMDRYSED